MYLLPKTMPAHSIIQRKIAPLVSLVQDLQLALQVSHASIGIFMAQIVGGNQVIAAREASYFMPMLWIAPRIPLLSKISNHHPLSFNLLADLLVLLY
jgi:hypothetical protein